MDKELKIQIEEDIFRYYNNEIKPRLYKLRTPAIKYVIVFRKTNYYKKKNKKIRFLFNFLLLRFYSEKYSYQIHLDTKIGRGLYIGHYGRLIISNNAVLGDNINLSTGVTIGQQSRGKKLGCPTIGNKVWIGTNAVIVGKIYIGDNVLIAPNAYVNFDVPSNSIVVGNPAKVISKEDATVGYINNPV